MKTLDRITIEPEVKASIRGLTVAVGTVVRLLTAERSPATYTAWRLEECEEKHAC